MRRCAIDKSTILCHDRHEAERETENATAVQDMERRDGAAGGDTECRKEEETGEN